MAKEAKYLYSGPLSGVTLDNGKEVMLHPGEEVQLPVDNSYVKSLVVQRLLTEASPEAAAEIITPIKEQKKETAHAR